DLPREPPAAAAGRGLQLPHRPAGPLRVLRPLALEVQLPALLRPRVAARQLAAAPPEPAAVARGPPTGPARRVRARRREALRAERGGAEGARVAAARPAASAPPPPGA